MDRMEELRNEAEKDLQTELRDLIPLLSAARGIVSHSPSSQIVVQAGGVGVWIAATCAGLCFVMTLTLVLLYVDHSRKIDDLNHYLNAIYMQAPQLKPEEK